MKKILYITNLPAPYKILYFNQLGRYVDLTVIYERKKAQNRNIKWKLDEEKRYFKEIYLRGMNIGDESSVSFEVIKYIKNGNFDIVMMNGYSSLTSMIAITYMKIHSIHYGIICDGILPGKDLMLKEKIKKFLISSATFYMSSGKTTRDMLLKYGAKKEKIYWYPFSSIEKKEILNIDYDKHVYKRKIGCHEKRMILYVGQLIHRKGVDILISAFEKLGSDTRLYIVGGNTEQCKEYQETMNDQTSFIEFKTKEELSNYYKAADVFVLPTREDIWGLVVNEAFSYGLPVITTQRCGAGLEMIENGYNGYVVPINNSEELRTKTLQILNLKSEELNKVRLNCIRKAEKYSIENMVKYTLNIIGV